MFWPPAHLAGRLETWSGQKDKALRSQYTFRLWPAVISKFPYHLHHSFGL